MRLLAKCGLSAAFTLTACSFNSAPVVAPTAMPAPVDRIPRYVLLLVPREFSEYSYTGSHEDRKFTYTYGPGATRAITTLLRGSFDSLHVQAVEGETEIYAMLGQQANPELAQYDYVAVPKFVSTGIAVTPGTHEAQVALKIDFIPRDRGKSLAIEGSGAGGSHLYLGGPVAGAGSSALRQAVMGLRAELQAKRSTFIAAALGAPPGSATPSASPRILD